MKQEEVLGALIGLTGAISNNGKTADTDRIVAGALTGDDYEKSIRELHEEKNRIAPVRLRAEVLRTVTCVTSGSVKNL